MTHVGKYASEEQVLQAIADACGGIAAARPEGAVRVQEIVDAALARGIVVSTNRVRNYIRGQIAEGKMEVCSFLIKGLDNRLVRVNGYRLVSEERPNDVRT